MKKYILIAAMVGIVCASLASAQTRSRFIDGPGDQGHLQFYDATSGVSIATFGSGGLTVTGLVASGAIITQSVTIAGATAGALTVQTNATFSATAGRVLVGTNVGVSAQLTLGTNVVKIVNGIVTATGL